LSVILQSVYRQTRLAFLPWSYVRTRPDHVIRFGPIGLPPIVGSSNAALLVVSGETWAKVPGRFAEGLQDHRRRSSGLSPKVGGSIADAPGVGRRREERVRSYISCIPCSQSVSVCIEEDESCSPFLSSHFLSLFLIPNAVTIGMMFFNAPK